MTSSAGETGHMNATAHSPRHRTKHRGNALAVAHSSDIAAARERLEEPGGYEILHQSARLEIGVYVLVAPEPDRQQAHKDDKVYVVLEGNGVLDVDGKRVELFEGDVMFVPAGAEHRFVGYENDLTLLVIAERRAASRSV
jgi:mannose-6-phosphate isomerase-like protein (cupin superfamily)